MTKVNVEVPDEFLFLNRLRESGVTNMFGASPYLVEQFGMTRHAANTMLSNWMRWVEENPENLDR